MITHLTTEVKEGDLIVTVARAGSKTANCGNGISKPIFQTAVYAATPRQSDGKLTWRRVRNIQDETSGFISGAMVRRAKEYAETNNLPYKDAVRHGDAVN